MGACRFLYNNCWKDGTLTYSSQDPNFPALNTRHRWHTKSWRSTGISNEWLKVNRAITTPAVQAVAMRLTNYSDAAVSKFEWSSDDFSNTAGAFTCDNNAKIVCGFLGGSKGYQYWRHVVQDSGNMFSYLEVGYIFVGPYFEPSRNRNYNEGETPNDPSLLKKSEGGQISSVIRDQFFQKKITFSHLTETDKLYFSEMFELVGVRGGVFYVEDSSYPMSTTHYVRIVSYEWTFANNNDWSLSMSLEELL